MTDPESSSHEALTKEEMQSASPSAPREKRKNAFSALMAPKKKPPPPPAGASPFKNRMGLGAYLGDPGSFPASVVIAHSADFVLIHDKFPKATVHTLLLPRAPAVRLLHPFDALADPVFLARVRAEAARARALVAGELQRRLGRHSAAEAARQAVLDGGDAGAELPRGRDWAAEVVCGVHAVPSMSHVHVHVLSRDMHAETMRHRKHYNSFVTPFLVDLDDFPLSLADPRRATKREGYLARELRCWRCGRGFGNQFKMLKEHLEEEFEAWKKE